MLFVRCALSVDYLAMQPNLELKTRPKTTYRFSPIRYHAPCLELINLIVSDEGKKFRDITTPFKGGGEVYCLERE